MGTDETGSGGTEREDGSTPRVTPASLLVFLALPAGAGAVLLLVFGPGILLTFFLLSLLVAVPIVATRIFAGPPRKESP
jgi:hypothetical protein